MGLGRYYFLVLLLVPLVISVSMAEGIPNNQQDCIDEADELLSTVTFSTTLNQNLDIFINAEDNYVSCMEEIGISESQFDTFYGVTSSQSKKIDDAQNDCDFYAATQNMNDQEKMDEATKKCDVQYVQMVRDAIEENRNAVSSDKFLDLPDKITDSPQTIEGEEAKPKKLVCGFGTHEEDGVCVLDRATMTTEMQQKPSNGGGCLIATATFGSELAPQVQQLREIRDNTLLQTDSGKSFMQGFNEFYYSFSPVIADYERQNPVFKDAVKVAITPLITSLTILNYVEIDSEIDMIGYGVSLILLNVSMYFVAPAIVILKIRKQLM